MGEAIVNLAQLGAQASDVYGTFGEKPLFSQRINHREQFLAFAKSEHGYEHAAPLREDLANGRGKTQFLLLTTKAVGLRGGAPSALHDDGVDAFLREFSSLHQRLVMEVDITCVENPAVVRFDDHGGGTENVARVLKPDGDVWDFIEAEPVSGKIESLSKGKGAEPAHTIGGLPVGEGGGVSFAIFMAFHHHVDGVMKHHVRQLKRGVRHEGWCVRVLAHEHRQGAQMVLVRVGQNDGVQRFAGEPFEKGQALFTLHFWVCAAVQHDATPCDFKQVAVCADFDLACKISKAKVRHESWCADGGEGVQNKLKGGTKKWGGGAEDEGWEA